MESYLDKLKVLKAEKKYNEAISMLEEVVEEMEKNSKKEAWPAVGPYPYLELAKLYSRIKDYNSEIKILERYFSQTLARGQKKLTMAERYKKACERHNHVMPKHVESVVNAILADMNKFEQDLFGKILKALEQ